MKRKVILFIALLIIGGCGGNETAQLAEEVTSDDAGLISEQENNTDANLSNPATNDNTEEASSVEEVNLQTDAINLEASPTDTDGDGFNDKDDAFPLDATEWLDTDKDSIGDNKDNCLLTKNPDQKNTDLEYFNEGIKTPDGFDVEWDNLGDTCDDDLDGDGEHIVYVDSSVSDTKLGTFYEPVQTIQEAITLAKSHAEHAIYVSAGAYSLAGAVFESGINIYGGHKNGFAERRVHSDDVLFKTTLINDNSPVALYLEKLDGALTLDGFFITSGGVNEGAGGIIPDTDEYGCGQAAVFIRNSKITLSNNIIAGSASSPNPCGVILDGAAETVLDGNQITAGGGPKAFSSTGISIVGTPAIISNNIIIAGNGKHVAGMKIFHASPFVINNTIDASSGATNPKTSVGIAFDGGSFELINNLIFTDSAGDQISLLCSGSEPDVAEIKNNILTTFPQEGTNAVFVNCEGDFTYTTDFIADPNFTLNGTEIIDNVAFFGELDQLIENNYGLAGPTGLDAGMIVDLSTDFNGDPRPNGAGLDIGAIER